MPSVISFGIVSVGDRYGAMYELVDAETISRHVARNPGQEEGYAKIMAGLAHEIHGDFHAGNVFLQNLFPDG